MPVELSASISIRHGDMVNFGTLVRLEDAVAGITTDGRYEVGDFIEFQLELTGWDATVSGIAEVRRAGLREGHANRYLLQILEMRRSDRKLLQSWYEDLSAVEEDEGEFAAFALDSEVGSYAPPRAAPHLPRPPVGGPPVSTPAEQRSNWMNDRAITISQTVEHQGSRRQALRAVLRAAFSEHAERGPHEQAGGEEVSPKTTVRLGSGLPRVELVYEDDTSWRAAWTAWLHQGLAFVRYTESVPVLEQQALVRLRYRSFVDVTCPARVVVVHKTGFGMVLDLDPLQLDALESVTEEAHLGRVRVADRLEYDPGKEATSPASRSFWSRLFGLTTSEEPLDAAIRALPDPLAALELDHPQDRHRLDAILAKADTDYLVLCDEVARFLGRTRWRWEELEARTRGSSKPIDQAAAFLVLAHVTRSEAVAAVREASATSTPEEVRITIEPGPDASCAVCRRWHGAPTSPLNLARRGLPPYHVGCECRVVRVKEE
ncbi:MAG: hypothetical protein ABIO70_33875 [Pseudomonadota bacterium]